MTCEAEETTEPTKKSRRGFAAMAPERQRALAGAGGKGAHKKGTAHEFTEEEARAAGVRGGRAVSVNKAHMAQIGKRGGNSVSKNREHMAEIGRRGGRAVSSDPAHMAAIGRKGGRVPRVERP